MPARREVRHLLSVLRDRARHRVWPCVAMAVTVVAGMAYTFLAAYRLHGRSTWMVPGDVWGAFRSAQLVGWGHLGRIYSSGTGLVTFPGVLLLLTPVAMLSGALGLSESFPFALPHPTAWLILGPYEIALSSVALFACDALAERIGVSSARRFWLCAAEAVVLWNVDVIWGHPEDALAVALALYALISAFDGRWVRCGWLFGAALATQPLVILLFPVILAMGRRTECRGLLVRATLPTLALIVVPFATNARATAHAVLEQPNFPAVDHVTPWTSLAPRLGGTGKNLAVAAGPGRVVAILLACAIGAWVWWRRPDPGTVVLAVAVALSLRCLTESVMVPFYFWPPVAVGLIGAARAGPWRLAAAAAAGTAITVFSDYRSGPWWLWWSAVSLGILVVLVMAVPSRLARDVGAGRNFSSSPPKVPEQLLEDGSVLSAPPSAP